MRIDNWPLDRIMRLPDWCFGRRWWIGEYMGHTGGKADYTLGEEQLPDKFVVWGVLICSNSPACLQAMRLTIRLGTTVPAIPCPTLEFERLLKGISIPSIVYELYVDPNGTTWINCERQLIESAGRRLCIITNGDQTIAYEMTVGVLISAMPKEVPDWLVSGKGNAL